MFLAYNVKLKKKKMSKTEHTDGWLCTRSSAEKKWKNEIKLLIVFLYESSSNTFFLFNSNFP